MTQLKRGLRAALVNRIHECRMRRNRALFHDHLRLEGATRRRHCTVGNRRHAHTALGDLAMMTTQRRRRHSLVHHALIRRRLDEAILQRELRREREGAEG